MATDDLRQLVAGLSTEVPTTTGMRPYVNFDNAASTPPFVSVLQAVNDFAPWYSSVHRGNGFKSRLSTQVYEEARTVVEKFVGADPDGHVVIFVKNTTEALNKLSYRLQLRKTDIVLISHLEHHSNDLPWRAHASVKRIGLNADGGVDRRSFLALLKRYAGRVRLVSISGASNVTGHIPDVHWFAAKAHEAGAYIAVDCAQLAAHRPIHMGRLTEPEHIDFIALSGHKMYAPFGAGVLVGRRDVFHRGDPEYSGGGTVAVVTPRTVDWLSPPDSEEAGSPNVIGALALARAIRTLERIGLDAVSDYESSLAAYALRRLMGIPGITLYGTTNLAAARSAVIPFSVAGLPAQLVAAILGYEWGIGVRSGCFCAQPYVMQLLNLDRAAQQKVRYHVLHRRRDLAPGLVRISFGMYNTRAEIDVLAAALQAIASGGYGAFKVNRATGIYAPVGFADTFSRCFSL